MALLIGTAYVFGMVLPLLLLIAILWDRFDWGSSSLLRGRLLVLPVGRRRLAVHTTALAGGVLLLGMGVLIVVLAFRGPAMSGAGWQASVSSWLQHAAHVIVTWLSFLPGWVTGLMIFGALALIVRTAVRQRTERTLEADPLAQADATEPLAPPEVRPPVPDTAAAPILHGERR